jgi:ABC-type sulfate/molybdate transport systems ATPase subunit
MILLEEIAKAYGAILALKSVSLEIEQGETVVIQGPSGSGKTTLLRLIAGLELPDNGRILMDGDWVSGPGWATAPHTRDLGVVFQRSALWPHMTVSQNLRFAARRQSSREQQRWLHKLLDWTGLSGLADRYPSQLSGGEARRAALARALAPRPRRLLLDEPLTSVDPDRKTELLRVLRTFTQETGCTMLFITHIREEAQLAAGRLFQMRAGSLQEAE